MAMAMASGVSPISEISHAKENWNILAKIVRLWLVRDFTKHKIPFSIEIVLMDEHGKTIHASVRRTLVYKFETLLKEGSIYSIQFLSVAANVGAYKTYRHSHKLIFQISTKVQILDTGRVVGHEYELVPIPQITAAGFDSDFLVDVIGVITGVGSKRQYERNGTKTKLNVISLEAAGHKIECTLFGEYIDELNTFFASGEIDNVVVIIQYAKKKCICKTV